MMDDVRYLSVEIGPRRPTAGERAAAAYVHGQIRALDPHWELTNQPFHDPGFRWRIAPVSALTGLSLLAGLKGGRQRRWIAGLVSVALSPQPGHVPGARHGSPWRARIAKRHRADSAP